MAVPMGAIKKHSHHLALSFYLQILWTQKIFDKKPIQWIKNNVTNVYIYL